MKWAEERHIYKTYINRRLTHKCYAQLTAHGISIFNWIGLYSIQQHYAQDSWFTEHSVAFSIQILVWEGKKLLSWTLWAWVTWNPVSLSFPEQSLWVTNLQVIRLTCGKISMYWKRNINWIIKYRDSQRDVTTRSHVTNWWLWWGKEQHSPIASQWNSSVLSCYLHLLFIFRKFPFFFIQKF